MRFSGFTAEILMTARPRSPWDQTQAPLVVERIRRGTQDVAVQALAHAVAPDQFAVHHRRLLEIGLDPLAHDGGDVGVDIAGLGQFAGR